MGVGFEDEMFADQGRRSTVAVAVEANADIVVNQRISGVAVVGPQRWQCSQGLRLEAIHTALPRFAVLALVGNFSEPLARRAWRLTSSRSVKERKGQKYWRT
jgi:hypothetical protein